MTSPIEILHVALGYILSLIVYTLLAATAYKVFQSARDTAQIKRDVAALREWIERQATQGKSITG